MSNNDNPILGVDHCQCVCSADDRVGDIMGDRGYLLHFLRERDVSVKLTRWCV